VHGVLGCYVTQACDKFDVAVADVAGATDQYLVSIVLISAVKYSVRSVYTMTIRAVVRVSACLFVCLFIIIIYLF